MMTISLAATRTAAAQDSRPQIMPGERKAPRKKDAGPRALAVLRLAANGKSSLVPIAILINGKFWDAAAYKADPVPMALDAQTVYEVERTGNSLGLFTVQSALHATNANAPVPWLATGDWRPIGAESSTKQAKAEPVPAGVTASDAPPRLTRNPDAANSTSTSANTGTIASVQPPASSKPAGSSSSSDEPPRLKRPADSSSPSTDPASPPGNTSPNNTSPASSAPSSTAAKPDAKPANNLPASDSGAKQGYRPQLRRGKPAESFADETIPGYSKPGQTASSSDKKSDTDLDSNVQIIPAISDASDTGPHSFTFDFSKEEETDRRTQMTALAQSDLHAYADARIKATTTAAAKPAHATTKKNPPKPPDAVFDNVKMTAYDLWNSNTPIIVFSADARIPPPAASAFTDSGTQSSATQYSILLVAYPDIYGNLRKLYSGVTDKYHLDVTSKLELVDAVDADGDGRGELLFRETSDAGAGWAIYGASADKLWKIYDSLNPE
jgi:hypothetical protein